MSIRSSSLGMLACRFYAYFGCLFSTPLMSGHLMMTFFFLLYFSNLPGSVNRWPRPWPRPPKPLPRLLPLRSVPLPLPRLLPPNAGPTVIRTSPSCVSPASSLATFRHAARIVRSPPPQPTRPPLRSNRLLLSGPSFSIKFFFYNLFPSLLHLPFCRPFIHLRFR